MYSYSCPAFVLVTSSQGVAGSDTEMLHRPKSVVAIGLRCVLYVCNLLMLHRPNAG